MKKATCVTKETVGVIKSLRKSQKVTKPCDVELPVLGHVHGLRTHIR